jgi:hypothetical protein
MESWVFSILTPAIPVRWASPLLSGIRLLIATKVIIARFKRPPVTRQESRGNNFMKKGRAAGLLTCMDSTPVYSASSPSFPLTGSNNFASYTGCDPVLPPHPILLQIYVKEL